MTAKQAAKDRAAIIKIGKETDRKENAKLRAKLDAALKLLRDELRANLKEQKESCDAEFQGVKAEAEAAFQAAHTRAVELRRARKARKRTQCRHDAREIREAGKRKIEATRAAGTTKLKERIHDQGADARVAAAQKARAPKIRPIERLQESDDSVEKGIDPSLVVVWRKVKNTIRGTDRMSRLEAFQQWMHENEGTAQDIQVAAAERELERDMFGMGFRPPPPPPRKRATKPREVQQRLTERWGGVLGEGESDAQRNLRPQGRKRRPGRHRKGDAFEDGGGDTSFDVAG